MIYSASRRPLIRHATAVRGFVVTAHLRAARSRNPNVLAFGWLAPATSPGRDIGWCAGAAIVPDSRGLPRDPQGQSGLSTTRPSTSPPPVSKSSYQKFQGAGWSFLVPEIPLPDYQVPNVELTRIGDVLLHPGHEDVTDSTVTRPSGSSLAYVIFTSGSTGKPKRNHGTALAAWVNVIKQRPAYGHVAHMSNLAFDPSIFEMCTALLNGSSLYAYRHHNCVRCDTVDQNLQARRSPALARSHLPSLPESSCLRPPRQWPN